MNDGVDRMDFMKTLSKTSSPSKGSKTSFSKTTADFIRTLQAEDESHCDIIDNAHVPACVSLIRRRIAGVLKDRYFEYVLSCIILINILLLIVETDAAADKGHLIEATQSERPLALSGALPRWTTQVNSALIVFYTLELSARIFVFSKSYFRNPWNCVDASVVLIDLLLLLFEGFQGGLPHMSVMRSFVRVLRLSRSKRLMLLVPEFNVQVQCLLGAMKPLFWGCLFILLTLVIWGIFAVILLHPINVDLAQQGVYDDCKHCSRSFETVGQAMLTFAQSVLVGDSWGMTAVPIIEHSPATSIFFALVYSSLALTLVNVCLSGIVDSANRARVRSDAFVARMRDEDRKAACKQFLEFCVTLDSDQDGHITKQEFESGCMIDERLQDTLRAMDLRKEDVDAVWSVLDAGGAGKVEYNEFTENLYKMKLSDAHTMLVFLQHYVADIREKCKQHITMLTDDVIRTIKDMRHMEEDALHLLKEEKLEFAMLKDAAHKRADPLNHQNSSLNALFAESVFPAVGQSKSLPSGCHCTGQGVEVTTNIQFYQHGRLVQDTSDRKNRSDPQPSNTAMSAELVAPRPHSHKL